ncbi:FAD-dependent thymidylate synthase [Candidatus Micrarchaeota archaeon]|nr:FAD-dependent thymidylate synthase [Candidatus Micrarchaeota archaeon]
MDVVDDKIVNYFFTNKNKPVFYSKNLHPEVWALFQARYSRSTEGLREGFIKLLKEANKEYLALRETFEKNDEPSVELTHALDKAVKFMDKWVLGYGHSSVAEGAVTGVGIEGISILTTKYIETARLCSFIEKSTRYVHFDRNSFYKPKKIESSKFSKDYDYIIDLLFTTYEDLHEPVLEYVKKATEQDKQINEKAWIRACEARRFDAVRYLLPAATKTSFGWTVNARELAHTIQKLKSYPLEETQEIGDMLVLEGKKVLPSLLKYADKNEYLENRETALNKYFELNSEEKKGYNDVKLVDPIPEDEFSNVLIASLIYKNSVLSYSEAMEKTKKMNYREKIDIFNKVIEDMGTHDMPPREFENINFLWDITIDYGAFRDIQRHRIVSQSEQLLTTFLGYETPEDIVNAECSNEYSKAMDTADKVFKDIFQEMPYYAQYVVPLGYRKRVLMATNFRELHHIIKIRSTPHGHISYRNIVQKMHLLLKNRYGEWIKSIDCNFDQVDLGRLKSELKIQETIDSFEK